MRQFESSFGMWCDACCGPLSRLDSTLSRPAYSRRGSRPVCRGRDQIQVPHRGTAHRQPAGASVPRRGARPRGSGQRGTAMDARAGGWNLVPPGERTVAAGRSAATAGVSVVRASQPWTTQFLRGVWAQVEPVAPPALRATSPYMGRTLLLSGGPVPGLFRRPGRLLPGGARPGTTGATRADAVGPAPSRARRIRSSDRTVRRCLGISRIGAAAGRSARNVPPPNGSAPSPVGRSEGTGWAR